MKKTSNIIVLGKHYKVEYVDKPSEVDIYKRKSLWGQVDYWTRTIRIYDNGTSDGDIVHVVLHEILHAIISELHINTISNANDYEDIVDLLALAMSETLTRNPEFTNMFIAEKPNV